MSTDTCHMPFMQHNNLIRMLNRADTLGDNQHRRFLRLLCQRFPQRSVCLEIQRRKTVVKNIELRLSDQCPGDGQTLFLSSGKIGSALGHIGL